MTDTFDATDWKWPDQPWGSPMYLNGIQLIEGEPRPGDLTIQIRADGLIMLLPEQREEK